MLLIAAPTVVIRDRRASPVVGALRYRCPPVSNAVSSWPDHCRCRSPHDLLLRGVPTEGLPGSRWPRFGPPPAPNVAVADRHASAEHDTTDRPNKTTLFRTVRS